MRHHALRGIVLPVVVLLAAACTPGIPTVGPTLIVPLRGLPCDAGTPVGDTTLTSPSFFALIERSTTVWPRAATLQWRYSGDCSPNGGFNVYLSTDRDRLMSTPVGNATGTSFRVRIEPGKRYYWTAAPVQDGVEAPVHDPATPGHGPGTAPFRWSFFTGPICDTYSLGPPTALSPIDGVTIDGLQPDMVWEYPDPAAIPIGASPVQCLPDYFVLDVSKDPAFSTIDVHFDTDPVPAKEVFLDPLDDCSRYYWRVRGIGDLGARSPWSDTENFVVDSRGLCAALIPGPIVPIPGPELPLLRPIQPLPCRLGPADGYGVMRYFDEQVLLPAVARDHDASWLQVKMEDLPLCWVPWDKVKPELPSFDPMSLPLGTWGPLPTETPESGPSVGCLIENPKKPGEFICVPRACMVGDKPGTPCTP